MRCGRRSSCCSTALRGHKADAKSRIDLSTQRPLEGSYRDADVRGLFWSMTPTEPQPTEAIARTTATATSTAESAVTLTALIDGKTVATQIVNLLADSRLTTLAVDAFPGAQLVALPGRAKRVAIIVLGGSEGGSYTARLMAPKLASQGYAVLGLPYYSPTGYSANGETPAELPTLPAAFADIPADRGSGSQTPGASYQPSLFGSPLNGPTNSGVIQPP